MSCARVPDAAFVSRVFDACFGESHAVRLVGGAPEPLYEPASAGRPALIHFRADYAASALHEAAHWCIAGSERRRFADYGYWYAPDGRDQRAQRDFARVESRPQALEWCFSQACGLPFTLSLDNLDAVPDPAARRELAEAIVAAGRRLRDAGLPPRAGRFFEALARHSGRMLAPAQLTFPLEKLL